MFWFKIKKIMQDVWAGFAVFTLRDQTAIVVAVKGELYMPIFLQFDRKQRWLC